MQTSAYTESIDFCNQDSNRADRTISQKPVTLILMFLLFFPYNSCADQGMSIAEVIAFAKAMIQTTSSLDEPVWQEIVA